MLFRLLTLFLFSLLSLPAAAQDGPAALASRDHPLPLATDFNLITAVDVSDSITPDDEHLQYSGLARGVLDPQFLARIAEGAEQRIGFVARSEARRVGKECVSTCRSRCARYHRKKKQTYKTI